MKKGAYIVIAELPGGGTVPRLAIIGAKTMVQAREVLKEIGPKYCIFDNGHTIYYRGPNISRASCWLTKVPLLRLRKSRLKPGEKHE